MSWATIHVLVCGICADEYAGRKDQPRARVLSKAQQNERVNDSDGFGTTWKTGWHSNTHGVLIVCDACIGEVHAKAKWYSGRVDLGRPSLALFVDFYADELRANDIPHAGALAELAVEGAAWAVVQEELANAQAP